MDVAETSVQIREATADDEDTLWLIALAEAR